MIAICVDEASRAFGFGGKVLALDDKHTLFVVLSFCGLDCAYRLGVVGGWVCLFLRTQRPVNTVVKIDIGMDIRAGIRY
jgi:hypothetical protein